MIKVRIYVSKENIMQGRCASLENCPVALAADEILGNLIKKIRVMDHTLGKRHDGSLIQLPWQAEGFIREYDSRIIPLEKFEPFNFVVEI